MICIHCNEDFPAGKSSSHANHIRRCPKNPDRTHVGMTEAGKERIRKNNDSRKEALWTDEYRRTHSETMKQVVKNNPTSYSSANRGRTKQIEIDGIKLQGQWEVDFYLWAKSEGLNPQRPIEAFPYEWNGTRQYHPDFYIPSLDLYIEVKGYETERDRAKWLHFPKNLVIIKTKEIEDIRQGKFTGPLIQRLE